MNGEVSSQSFPILRNAIENSDLSHITVKSEDNDGDEAEKPLNRDLAEQEQMEVAEHESSNDFESEDTVNESLPLEVQIEMKDSEPGQSINSIYICEVCRKDKRDYNTLGEHRSRVHKLPWRQERLGPYGEISSYVLHLEKPLVAKETRKLTYICEVCKKDCKNNSNLGSHRKRIHKLASRQLRLGLYGEISSYDLHPVGKTNTTLPTEDSVYVCEVCRKDYKCYRNLGDHRRHQHKLPFRQERLGVNFQIDSFDLHPENKNRGLSHATAESVYVCQVCNKDYKSYQNLKYHRKHTHKIAARQDHLGINFDIPTESLHPLPASQRKDTSNVTGPGEETTAVELTSDDIVVDGSQEATTEEIYVCEVCKKVYGSYRQLGDHRRCSHKLPFRQETLGRNGELSSYDLHPENKSATDRTALADSIYVCEVCRNDYRTYQNLKYHRKHTHKLQARQEMLGVNGDIRTEELHPMKNQRKNHSVGSQSTEQKAKAQTVKTDSVYVCEICKNDYKSYQNLKYHRKNTHGIAARQNRLGINGEIATDDIHPLKRFQKVESNGKISVQPIFPKGLAKKHYHTEVYCRRLEQRLQALIKFKFKNEDIREEIDILTEIQSLRNEFAHDSEIFKQKLNEYRQKKLSMSMSNMKSLNELYVCEVCHQDFKSYKNLGNHRTLQHNLPFRQGKLGIEMRALERMKQESNYEGFEMRALESIQQETNDEGSERGESPPCITGDLYPQTTLVESATEFFFINTDNDMAESNCKKEIEENTDDEHFHIKEENPDDSNFSIKEENIDHGGIFIKEELDDDY